MIDSSLRVKALRDPYYSGVVKNFGEAELERAGFFDDGAPIEMDPAAKIDYRFLVTPLHKLQKKLEQLQSSSTTTQNKIAVLLTSGGFCPIHNGHLQMIESARLELERQGYFVAGAFITPDHDSYVYKKCADKAIPASRRLLLAEISIKDSDWISVDPWAAKYLDRAINFSDMLRRLEFYLRHNLNSDKDIKLFFVCGADNNQFYKAFYEKGGLVIVPRVGQALCIDSKLLIGKDIYIANQHQANNISSSAVRKGELSYLHNAVAGELDGRIIDFAKISVRNEGNWSVQPWVEKYGQVIESARERFQKELLQVIETYFKKSGSFKKVQVEQVKVAEQLKALQQKLNLNPRKTISLDPCYIGDYNVGLSRRFSVSDNIRYPGLYSRPGFGNIAKQIAAIPPGEYCLVEDDIATGNTIREFQQLLPESVKISEVVSLNKLVLKEDLSTIECQVQDCLHDAVDLRDFLVGSREGGLVLELPDSSIVRAPYLLPYVKNTSRMSLPVEVETEFSIEVWKLNLKFFEECNDLILIADCSQSFQKLAKYLGFDSETKMTDFCRWHLNSLS
jgi:nicotinic acid mononucleotide adenylyltransferase